MMKKNAGEKFVTRRVRQKKSRRRKLLSAILISCFIVSSAIFVLQMDCWRIKIVEVKGTERVSPEKVYKRTGIHIGDHMLFMSKADIKRRLFQIQLVKDVSVEWRLPNRMIIRVGERQPFAYIVYRKKYYLVDKESVLLEKPTSRPIYSLLLVRTDELNTKVEVGYPVRFPHAQQFYEVCGAMNTTVGEWIKEIVFSVEGVVIFLKKGLYVLLGEGDMAEEKLSLIPLLLTSEDKLRGEISGIDLRYIDSPSFIMK